MGQNDYWDTSQFQSDLRLVFDCIRLADRKQEFQRYVREEPAFSNLDRGTYDVIPRYTNVLGEQALDPQYNTEGGKINMCQAMQELLADHYADGMAQG